MEKLNLALGISNTACSLLVAALSLPLIRGKIKMNTVYGVRFRKAYQSEELWYKINKKGGRLLLLWSLPIFALGIYCLLGPTIKEPFTRIAAYAPLLYLIAALQTYNYSRKL